MSVPADAKNLAATLPVPKADPYVTTNLPIPTPGPADLLIRVHAVAINPADSIVQERGILFPAEAYPLVPGGDVAGVVVSAPSDSGFRPGDRVCACLEFGAFQRYAVARAAVATRIPAGTSFAQASVLPLCFCTAVGGLAVPGGMGLRLPSKDRTGEVKRGEAVLVWGGASSVGSCAVQLLVAAGYRVATTASVANAGYVRELGAEWAFDYKKDGIEREIKEVLGGSEFAGVFSTVSDEATLEMCARIVDVLAKEEKGRVLGTVLPPFLEFKGKLPEGVRIAYCNSVAMIPNSSFAQWFQQPAPSPEVLKMGAEIWSWLGWALENGNMKCKPDPRVVGHGVEDIQKGVDAWRKGVSAEKIVVEIP